jgi:hypothetical protein
VVGGRGRQLPSPIRIVPVFEKIVEPFYFSGVSIFENKESFSSFRNTWRQRQQKRRCRRLLLSSRNPNEEPLGKKAGLLEGPAVGRRQFNMVGFA